MSSKTKIPLDKLYFYFEGVEKDSLDLGAVSRKNGEWMAMRQKLVKLPEATFDVVMRSIDSLVDSVSPLESEKTAKEVKVQHEEAKALFERVVASETQAKINSHSTSSLEATPAI